jgi:hypothetical protein
VLVDATRNERILGGAIDDGRLHADGLTALFDVRKRAIVVAKPVVLVLEKPERAVGVRSGTSRRVTAHTGAVARSVCRAEPVGARGPGRSRRVRATTIARPNLRRVDRTLVLAVRDPVVVGVDVGNSAITNPRNDLVRIARALIGSGLANVALARRARVVPPGPVGLDLAAILIQSVVRLARGPVGVEPVHRVTGCRAGPKVRATERPDPRPFGRRIVRAHPSIDADVRLHEGVLGGIFDADEVVALRFALAARGRPRFLVRAKPVVVTGVREPGAIRLGRRAECLGSLPDLQIRGRRIGAVSSPPTGRREQGQRQKSRGTPVETAAPDERPKAFET